MLYDGTRFVQQPQFVIVLPFSFCLVAGCTASTSLNYESIDAPFGMTLDYCGANLAVAATGSAVVVDIQDSTNTSILTGAKISIGTSITTTVYQTTFASTPYLAAKGAKFRIQVTSGDSNNVAQYGFASCTGHF